MANQVSKQSYDLLIGFFVIPMPWLFVWGLREFGPLIYEPLDGWTVIFLTLACCVGALTYVAIYVMGALFALKPSSQLQQWRDEKLKYGVISQRILHITFYGTCVYLFVSAYDFFILKSAVLSEIVAVRESEHLTGPRNSLVGALGALTSGFPAITLAAAMIVSGRSSFSKCVIICAAVLGIFATFLTGGRNGFFISIAFLLVFRLIIAGRQNRGEKKKFSFRKIIFVAALLTFFCLGIFYSLKIFVARFEVYGGGVSDMLAHLESDYPVQVDSPEGAGSTELAIYSVMAYLVFYLTHSFTYLDEYFSSGVNPLFKGAYGFPLVSRMMDQIFGSSSFSAAQDGLLLPGVYLSLPGTLYLDFGFSFTLLIMFFLTIITTMLMLKRKNLNIGALLLLAYLLATFAFAPVYSVYGMANGFPMLLVIITCCISSLSLSWKKLIRRT